jgi:uncharacterized protein (TIGR03118 family)
MQSYLLRPARYLTALSAVLAFAAACDNTSTTPTPIANSFVVSRLVADVASAGAVTTDAALQNAWGLAFGPGGNLWVADNHSSTSTVYTPMGEKLSTTVSIMGSGGLTAGAPTGIVENGTTAFNIGVTGPATFIWAGEDGTISAWNPASGSTASVMVDNSLSGAVYKGIAMASSSGSDMLYATDFHNSRVDVYDGSFNYVTSFTDAGIPSGYAPFGIANMNGQLWVTYAKQLGPDNVDDEAGLGNGYVDIFSPAGTLVQRFASNGKLNSPWAIAMAPTGFSGLSGTVLIGNFGDGRILSYNASTGAFIAYLHDANGSIISLDGLWALTFRPSASPTTLYFSSGPNDETNGLVGTITPQ